MGDVLGMILVVVGSVGVGFGVGLGIANPVAARCEGYAAGSGLTCKVMEKSCWCEDESGAWREAEQ